MGNSLAMAVRNLASALVGCAALLLVMARPAIAQQIGWPQAVDQLAREKTLAEACASVLKTFADGAPMALVQGERLYARAEADMDGLVGLLIADLASERSPADVPELRHRLRRCRGSVRRCAGTPTLRPELGSASNPSAPARLTSLPKGPVLRPGS
jgi:hypothetical protein